MLTLNDPQSMRINSELALEIGLNESVMLLQIEYLISISGHEHECKRWTFQTLEDLRDKYFRWWSVATISRTLKALESANFIHIGNFNKRKSDRTHWFALNLEGIANLKSVTIFQIEKCILQDEKSISQNATSILQDEKSILQIETALPETSSEITTETTSEKDVGSRADALSPSTKISEMSESEFMTYVKSEPAYSHIDVEREAGKMRKWCATRNKQPTRRRFINWLNNVDLPLGGTPEGNGNGNGNQRNGRAGHGDKPYGSAPPGSEPNPGTYQQRAVKRRI
jgi:Fe2+ or Zn2+ uptake regulation protein